MQNKIATLLPTVAFAMCLRDTVAVNIVLEVSDVYSRAQWGANDILLTCTSWVESQKQPIHNAIFTKDQILITISANDNCTPNGDQYCYVQDGQRLSFTANSATEGKYACTHQSQTSNELAIVGKCVLILFCDIYYPYRICCNQCNQNTFCAAYPDEVSSGANQTGKWGEDLVLPCRFAPGPLANDPTNFYHHTWSSSLNGAFNPVPSNSNNQDNSSDFSLTLVKLNPLLAEYDTCATLSFQATLPHSLTP